MVWVIRPRISSWSFGTCITRCHYQHVQCIICVPYTASKELQHCTSGSLEGLKEVPSKSGLVDAFKPDNVSSTKIKPLYPDHTQVKVCCLTVSECIYSFFSANDQQMIKWLDISPLHSCHPTLQWLVAQAESPLPIIMHWPEHKSSWNRGRRRRGAQHTMCDKVIPDGEAKGQREGEPLNIYSGSCVDGQRWGWCVIVSTGWCLWMRACVSCLLYCMLDTLICEVATSALL